MSERPELLINIKELDAFLEDQLTVSGALAHAQRFATAEPFEDRQEAGDAADAIKALAIARKSAEERKLGITARWRASTAAVNAEYKELLSPIDAAERALKQKGLAFKKAEDARAAEKRRQEQEEIDRKAEEAAKASQEAAEKAAEEGDAESRRKADEAREAAAAAAVAQPAPSPDAPKQVRGGFATLGSRTVWKAEVTDAALVPDRHKVIDPRSIKAEVDAESRAAKAEERSFKLEIPGVRIYSEEIAVSR